ncbi:MAG: flagellar motor switch protein FliN [Methylococcales bacterium]|nr:flagellar motor switch protein FliN [Methylococcales bacterium]
MSEEEQETVDDDWAAAMDEQSSAEAGKGDESDAGNLESAQFDELEQTTEGDSNSSEISSEEIKLDIILDVPVTISMEIGRTKLNIRNLLQLNQGSVIELDRFAGEPMDVLVNGTLIAHGEVVVVNEKFGIRLTDVISASERVKKLG